MQNKTQKIEGLNGLTKLRNLELAANKIRVRGLPETENTNDIGSGESGYSDRVGGIMVRKEQDYRAQSIKTLLSMHLPF